MLLDAAGVECSTGSACSAGIAQPSHVLLAMGADEARARGSLRFSLGHTSTEQTSTPSFARSPGRRPRPPCRPRRTRGLMRVVAAVSGGVDSAVAAARLVDAGHDVTASTSPCRATPSRTASGARGCCTLEDARDARRAADVLGVPFYVWDLADRFRDDVVDDFVDEYAAGRTPNPCLRCNEKIKFSAVLDKAVALGFDAVATGHYARIVEGPDGRELHRAVDPAKDQSYVLGVLTQPSWRRRSFPSATRPRTPYATRRRPRGSRSPASRTPTTSASSRTATPQASCASDSGPPLARTRCRRRSARRARRRACLHSRAAQGTARRAPAADGRPRYVLRCHRWLAPSRSARARSCRARLEGVRPRWLPAPGEPLECTAQVRAHGIPCPRWPSADGLWCACT